VIQPAGLEFLSAEWFGALQAALDQIEVSEAAPIVLGQIVTGVPSAAGADVSYTIAMGGGRPAVLTVDSLDSADVVLVTAYPDALAMATGVTTGSSLLAAGAVKIRGDAGHLVEASTLVEALGAASRQLHGIVT
jgi:hypothetical protein